ncbi:hypothetical protein BO82DRAFT_59225 [Aspergillus uvarum CBS 121591]|uniref:Uncharacterized protein n=1 Tax=Aspergillus uvarum CBS 121591 TaxID=1448315 RepID=A0A319CAR0_9EURO|nr:hypothetical protein BO82DRAFT_59225 [Aspergillus uvarum CBS 121591]PYH82575.1 hypothetical protein BO82DRAFT_59225 [Aspergillus uvarum CBS 121591]
MFFFSCWLTQGIMFPMPCSLLGKKCFVQSSDEYEHRLRRPVNSNRIDHIVQPQLPEERFEVGTGYHGAELTPISGNGTVEDLNA